MQAADASTLAIPPPPRAFTHDFTPATRGHAALDAEPDGSFGRGLAYALPISTALWAVIGVTIWRWL